MVRWEDGPHLSPVQLTAALISRGSVRMIEGKVSPSSQFCPEAIQSPSLFFVLVCFGLFVFSDLA